MTNKLFPSLCGLAFLTGASHAAVLFNESFDYGGSTVGFNSGSVGSWSSISGVLKYDHDGGLDHPQMSGETGGSMWLDFNAARTAANSDISLDLTTLGDGDTVWMSTLFQYVSGNNPHFLSIAGGSVSGMGLSVSGAGNVSVTATLNTTVNASNSTGINLPTGDYLMLLRYTKGSGTSPVDSSVDLWINPADTSSEATLGAADWTLDSGDGQVKWGRDGNSLTSLEAGPSQQGRIDEIRVTTSFAELNLAAAVVIPEPTTALLATLGGLLLLRRRR